LAPAKPKALQALAADDAHAMTPRVPSVFASDRHTTDFADTVVRKRYETSPGLGMPLSVPPVPPAPATPVPPVMAPMDAPVAQAMRADVVGMVREAVEVAMAPLVAKQRELEEQVTRIERRLLDVARPAKPRVATDVAKPAVAVRAAPAAAVNRPVADTSSVSFDIAPFDGERRKRAVARVITMILVLLVAGVATTTILSRS
jgi:hypothetical protein